jgi:hypothetical protein
MSQAPLGFKDAIQAPAVPLSSHGGFDIFGPELTPTDF